MPTSDDFKTELYRIMNEALFEGKSSAEINAGDLHRRVGGYPGPNHRMPVCSVVMLAAFDGFRGEAGFLCGFAGAGFRTGGRRCDYRRTAVRARR